MPKPRLPLRSERSSRRRRLLLLPLPLSHKVRKCRRRIAMPRLRPREKIYPFSLVSNIKNIKEMNRTGNIGGNDATTTTKTKTEDKE